MRQASYGTVLQDDRGTCVDGDRQFVTRLRAGDESAFAELVDQWSPIMFRVARSFVATRQSAEDVVQDAWVGVLGGLAGFEGRSSLRTWMFSILVNRARTRGAREARTIAWSPLDSEDGPTVDPRRFQRRDGERAGHWTSVGAPERWDIRPENAVLSKEALRLLEEVLATLPPRQREVVTMRDVQGRDAEDVCAALNISPQNQRVLLHRGRAVLRTALEDYYRG